MILANYDSSPQSQTQRYSYSSKSGNNRSYPIRINNPRIGKVNDVSVKIYGIEITENYTAVYMSWTNTEYKDGWYCVDKGIYIYIYYWKKYALKTKDNCAIKPLLTKIAYGQTKEFTLYFESNHTGDSAIDIIELGMMDGGFMRLNFNKHKDYVDEKNIAKRISTI